MKQIDQATRKATNGSIEAAVLLLSVENYYIVKTMQGEGLNTINETPLVSHHEATRLFNKKKRELGAS